ncbi:uncharacterized protein [Musca autumnalis]|uniref:uncharacterized protein n=1 Tax=Musca autumnalis TaxID=221902 RepID=UPI003CE993A4
MKIPTTFHMSDSEYSESFAGGGQEEGGGLGGNERGQQQQYQMQQNNAYGNFATGIGSSSSSSEGDSSVSSTSSDEDTDEENESDDSLELAKITNEVLSLPRGLCENPAIFQEFFSLESWQELPPHIQNHLHQYLPNFNKVLPPQMAAVEQTRSISMLFSGDLKVFGQSPLSTLQKHLEAGNYRPDIKKLRENIKKSQRRESKFQTCERLSYMAKELFVSRQRLLDHAIKSLPETVTKAPAASTSVTSMRQPKPGHLYHDNKLSAIRARKRFYTEISQIAQELNLMEDFVLSADEDNDMDNNLNEEWRKDLIQQQRSLEENAEPPKTNIALAERCVYSTVFRKRSEQDDEEAFRMQQRSRQSRLTNRNFKEYLREHKRRKLTEPTLPELETSDIRLRDVCARAQIGGNFKRVLGAGKPGRKPKASVSAASNVIPPNTSQLGTTENTENPLGINKHNLSTLPITPNNANTTPHMQTTPPATSTQQQQSTNKLSEPPALVPIQQPIAKKNEMFQQQNTGNLPTASAATTTMPAHYLQQSSTAQQQQMESPPPSFTKPNNNHQHLHNTSNDSLNMSSFMVTGHNDNLNLCMDDSSILATSDHDAFNMLDSEVELQQEEVETFGGDDNLSNFVIGDDIVLGGSAHHHHTHKNGNRNQQSHPLPKLEPISAKVSLKSSPNNQKSLTPSSSSGCMTNLICSSELIQETHASYFSLIRDFFCSTPNHRMRFDDLKFKIDIWLRNPITALNEWYAHADNWSSLLSSAINFLVGDFPDLPEEYVPYIEHKIQMNIYQWIGAGRDSDNRLTELCNMWMEKRKQPQENRKSLEGKLEVLPKSVVESDEAAAEAAAMIPPPPPPRFPTNWTVRPATQEEMLEFQRQERERFEQPHKAYTYVMHGYESVVGPVKGIYTPMLALAKARGHSMMVGDRPNFVTILTLVRDATARLPNGEGTRADISELLKCSQYINPDAAENVLQTIVSGALDRMHTEHDPCVRYDPKRKIWIYLHRNRTEEEFERIHQQNQTIGKTKKLQQRKPTRPMTTTSGGKLNSPEQETVESSAVANGSNGGGTLLSLPALVPANPIIVSNSSNVQRQQQSALTQQKHLQQQIQIQKCPPVPPLKYNIPPAQQQVTVVGNSPQQAQQQKSLLKPTLRQENKATTAQHSFQVPQAKTSNPHSNTTPIIVATPQGLQTVHVSNATSVVSSNSNNNPNKTNQQTSPVQQTNLTANLAGKRVMLNKPIIINQVTNQQSANTLNKQKSPQQQIIKQHSRITLSPQQQQQLQQQSSNIITLPISVANSININTNTSATAVTTDLSDNSISPSAAQSPSPSGGGKQNIIRLLPGSNVKTILTSPTGGSQQLVQRQRIVATNISATSPVPAEQRPSTPQQHQQQRNTAGFQLLSSSGNVTINSSSNSSTVTPTSVVTSSPAAGSIVKMSAQAFAALQQKQAAQQQQQQHIIMKQSTSPTGSKLQTTTLGQTLKTQRVILGNTTVIGQSSVAQGKNIVLQQLPVGSSTSVVVTPTTTTATSASSTLSGGSSNKIQTINTTILTPQQQRILMQNLKQQQQQQHQTSNINQNQLQFKTVQVVTSGSASTTQQQQQNIIQRQPQTITLAAQQSTNTNRDNVSAQQQNLTKILKTTGQQQQQQKSSEATSNPTAARIITSSGAQIISLDSLIQKQGGTLRIAGNVNPTTVVKANKQLNTTILQKIPQQQLQQQTKPPQSSSQQPQYAIVSVPNSIISLSNSNNITVGQRIITTQANSGSVNTSFVNVDATKVTPGIVTTASGQRRVLTTAGGTKIITKAGTATAAAAAGSNIRVLNTNNQQVSSGNINVTTLQGKPFVLASGKTVTAINKAQIVNPPSGQNIVQTSSGSIVIGGQTIKLQQGNTNIQQLLNRSGNIVSAQQQATTSSNQSNNSSSNSGTGQMQTVIMGNQILRVQQMPQIVTASGNRLTATNVIGNKIINSSESSTGTTNTTNAATTNAPKTILLGTGGQTLRLQTAASTGQATNKNVIINTNQQTKATLKTSSSTAAATSNRVVLAVQGGGQIFLSPNNINLKTLQNLKMVSLAQAKDQQQTSSNIQTQANILKISPSSTSSDANV